MSTLVGLQESRVQWERPIPKPLDEVMWQTWIAKGRERDRRSRVARGEAVKWLSITTLLVAAGLWTQAAPYDIVVRFIVASGAIIIMFQQLQSRHYAFAAVFAALVLLYNPLALVFNFSGDWQRALVVTSAVPFIASLAWRNARTTHTD